MAVFPGAVSTNSDLYVAVNNLSTVLNGAIGAGDTTITVSSTTGFPTVGIITIDLEAIRYTGTGATTFTGCSRGYDGTTAAAHADAVSVFHDIPAAHHNTLKDEVIAIETMLNAKLGTSAAAYTASRAIQSGTGGVLEVSTVTSTELGYVSGVTSAIQTQLNAKATDSLVVHLSGTETITGAKTFSSAVVISANSTTALTLNSNKVVVDSTNGSIGLGTAAVPGAGAGFDLNRDGDGSLFARVKNTKNTGTGQHAFYIADVTQASSDAYYRVTDGTTPWTMGLDGDDSSRFKISQDNEVGVNERVVIDPTTTEVRIKATNTNDNAASGFQGEFVEGTVGTTNLPATNTYGNNTSITLTAGDWEITVLVDFIRDATTASSQTRALVGIGTATGNDSTGLAFGSNAMDGTPSVYDLRNGTGIVPPWRTSLSGSQTYYLKVLSVYTTGTPQYRGRISARRIR